MQGGMFAQSMETAREPALRMETMWGWSAAWRQHGNRSSAWRQHRKQSSAWRQHGDVRSALRQHCERTIARRNLLLWRKMEKKRGGKDFRLLCVCCCVVALLGLYFIISSFVIILYFYEGFLSSRQTRTSYTSSLPVHPTLDEYVDS